MDPFKQLVLLLKIPNLHPQKVNMPNMHQTIVAAKCFNHLDLDSHLIWILHFQRSIGTLQGNNIAPEIGPSQKEIHLPTIHFQRIC